jgi:hypothetical protein
VHILTSKDREGEIQFLKEQSDLIEDVVDEVVHAYHHGFNKAIQNYSQVRRGLPITQGSLLFCFPDDDPFSRVHLKSTCLVELLV